jgi:nucleotide-binding universal stress UspA family protein
VPYYVDYVPAGFVTPEEHDKLIARTAEKFLSAVEKAAKAAGVTYEGFHISSEYADEAIVEAARKKKCDLIFIGSHGRGGVGRFFLGSVATKVLSDCDIPVLVYRDKKTWSRAEKG